MGGYVEPSIWDCQHLRKLRPHSDKTESGVNNQTPGNKEDDCRRVGLLNSRPLRWKGLPFHTSSSRLLCKLRPFVPGLSSFKPSFVPPAILFIPKDCAWGQDGSVCPACQFAGVSAFSSSTWEWREGMKRKTSTGGLGQERQWLRGFRLQPAA